MLEVTVGDLALGVFLGDEISLDVIGKRKAPDVGLSLVVEVDTTHYSFGSICGPQECWCLRDYLGKVSVLLAKAGCQ